MRHLAPKILTETKYQRLALLRRNFYDEKNGNSSFFKCYILFKLFQFVQGLPYTFAEKYSHHLYLFTTYTKHKFMYKCSLTDNFKQNNVLLISYVAICLIFPIQSIRIYSSTYLSKQNINSCKNVA